MINKEYGAFVIKTNKQAPGTFSISRLGGKGSMPLALLGAYTSVGIAKKDIDRYVARTRETNSASETTKSRRSK